MNELDKPIEEPNQFYKNLERDQKHLLGLRISLSENNISDYELKNRFQKYFAFKDWFETFYDISID